jgi:hypothetical protein
LKKRLSQEIRDEYKNYSSKTKAVSWFNQINIQTVLLWSAISILIYIIVFLFSKYRYIPSFFKGGKYIVNGLILTELPDNLLTIEIGIFSLFFSFVILIASFIFVSDNRESSSILVKNSNILSLVILNLFILFSFIFNKILWDSYLQVFPLFINTVLIFRSFYKTIRLLSDKEYFKQKKMNFIIDLVKENNRKIIKERIARNYLFKDINDTDLKIKYNPITTNGHEIKATKEGLIEDIKLNDLRKIINRIKDSIPQVIDSANSNISNSKLMELNVSSIEFNIRNSLGDQLKLGEPLFNIFCTEEIWSDLNIFQLSKDLNNSIIVSKKKQPNKKIKEIFIDLEDQLLQSIKNKKRNSINGIIDISIAIIESFQEMINYDYENGKSEFNSIGGGWSCIKNVSDMTRNSIIEAVAIEDNAILNKIISLPYSILILSIKNKDHYIFNEMSFLFEFLYYLRKKKEGSKIGNMLFSKSINLNAEISNLYISSFVKKSEPSEVSTLFRFSIRLLKSAQTIIKKMMDNNEAQEMIQKNIKKFKNMFSSLYFQVNEDIGQVFYFMEDSDSMIHFYKNDSLTENFSIVQINKLTIMFVLANYALQKGQTNIAELFMNYLPIDIDYITYIYAKSNDFSLENDFGWAWWGNEEYDDMEVHSLNHDTSDFFIYFLLKKIDTFTSQKVNYIFDDELIYLIKDENSIIQKKLESLSLDTYVQTELDKVPLIKGYILNIVSKYNENRNQIIASGKLIDEKMNDLQSNILEGYQEHFGLIDLYSEQKKIRNIHQMDKPKIFGGYNQLLNKEPYIEKGVGVVGIRQFGVGIKDFETQQIFKKWLNKSQITKFECNSSEIVECDISKMIILSTYRNRNEIRAKLRDEFINSWDIKSHPKYKNILGYYFMKEKNIPIINLRISDSEIPTSKLYLVDLKSIGSLEKELFDKNPLKFEIIDLNINEKMKKNIIDQNPQYLHDVENKDIYLRTRFVFKLFTSIKINLEEIKIYEI